jgi:hypothetical protein
MCALEPPVSGARVAAATTRAVAGLIWTLDLQLEPTLKTSAVNFLFRDSPDPKRISRGRKFLASGPYPLYWQVKTTEM